MMKTTLIYLLALAFFTSCAFGKNVSTEMDPILFLNSQDIPVFYENSPLTGLQSFTALFSFPLNGDLQKKLKQAIENSLGKIGEVVYLKDNDMRGFGSGNVLLIQVGTITEWDGNKLPISRVSLSVESSVTLDQTGVKTFPMIWSINTFLKGSFDFSSDSENNLLQAVQKLLDNFAKNYQFANKEQSKRTLFYIYQ